MSDFAVHVVNGGKKGRRGGGGGGGQRRRRRNPDGGGGRPSMGSLMRVDWGSLAWMLAGDFWIAYITRTWGGDGYGKSMFDGKSLTSPYQGQAWTLKHYMLAAATGFGIAWLMSRRGGRGAAVARSFLLGVKAGIIRRLVWTEGLSRTDWGPKFFGDITDAYADQGSVWMAAPGGYQQAMNGPEVGVTPWMLQGPEVQDQAWMMRGDSPMGHAIIGGGQSEDLASYQYSGDSDPYAASYST